MDEIYIVLDGIAKMIGLEGPIILDTGILEHDYTLRKKYKKTDDYLLIGKKGKKITFNTVYRAFKKIQYNLQYRESLNRGTYCFDGIYRVDDSNFKIAWGT